MAMRVDFYHLTRMPLERTLAAVARRVVADGGRLLVVSADARQRETLDGALWLPPESFLPHARAGIGDDRLQPVLIGETAAAGNGARQIALVDGVWREEALQFERAFHFFDEQNIVAARQAWKALADREVERRYWRQNEAGGWEQMG